MDISIHKNIVNKGDRQMIKFSDEMMKNITKNLDIGAALVKIAKLCCDFHKTIYPKDFRLEEILTKMELFVNDQIPANAHGEEKHLENFYDIYSTITDIVFASHEPETRTRFVCGESIYIVCDTIYNIKENNNLFITLAAVANIIAYVQDEQNPPEMKPLQEEIENILFSLYTD